MTSVGVRELRQNLSRYLERVKGGEAFIVTERGREVARLTPSAAAGDMLRFLVEELGATPAEGRPLEHLGEPTPRAPGSRPVAEILDELRGE